MCVLDGITLVSFEQFGAGPYASMFFAAMGATVIKVEVPATGGDYARHTGTDTLGENDSLYFQAFNLNKKSVALDIKSVQGREDFDALVPNCDAVINNLRGSQPAKLGLEYKDLSKLNERLVCGHISAYGRENSRKDWPGYDFLMQAEAGFMALTGDPGAPPTRLGLSMVDYMTGMTLAFAVMGAIYRARQSGEGCDIDVSLFDVAVHQLAYQGTWALNGHGVTPRQPRSAHPSNVPCQLQKTADGWIYIACMHQKFWAILARAIGLETLIEDPRFQRADDRLKNRAVLTDLLDERFQTDTTDTWLKHLATKIPVAPINELDKALSSPFLRDEAQMVTAIDHPNAGSLNVLSNPIRVNGKRLALAAGPKLGADTESVLNGAWAKTAAE